MTIPSNVYANSVFSEHPISLYSLDDDVSYISLISDAKRLFDSGGWKINSASTSVFDDDPELPDLESPFNSDIYSSVIGGVPSQNGENIEWESPTIFNLQDLNQDLKTFSISMYLYQDSVRVNWYEFGYVYGNGNEVVTRINAAPRKAWINFDFTYDPPNYQNNDVKIIIRANVSLDNLSQPGDYNFIVNGITVGQWSEKSSSKSLGVHVSEDIFLNFDGVEAREYGLQEQSGYYLVENKRLLAVNDGLPLVYGSENSTKIYPSASANPSLVFPGKGFLFESGKNKEYTIEFWMRINPKTIESRRIFGPMDTDNGLYVRDSVISLVIGNSVGSHPVSEWYRPMLIHIVLRENDASLMINGEQVFTINFDKSSTVFATENDLLGFYSFEDIKNFQLDCFSIYSYSVPAVVAKRRFVYGQGTNSPATISGGFQGKNAYINFSNSNYTVSKSYPDTLKWSAGASNNLISTRKSISNLEYPLPKVFIGGRDIQDLYNDNKIVNEIEDERFFTFRPHTNNNQYVREGTNWTEPGYLFFDSLSFVDGLSSIYSIFSVKSLDVSAPLITIKNISTSEIFEIYLDDNEIDYIFNGDSLYTEVVTENTFAAGIKIDEFSNNFGFPIKKFFNSLNNLQMYVGGNGVETFPDKIKSVGLVNKKDVLEILDCFFDDGVVDISKYQKLTEDYCAYKLVSLIRFNRFFLDISVHATWEEYFPLSSFAGYAKDAFGKNIYDLDFLQVDLGYPSLTEVTSKLIENLGWRYFELRDEYQDPITRTYSVLADQSVTGYEDYADLRDNNRIVEYFLDTEKSSLKSYITFQLLSEGANESIESFTNKKSASEVIYAENENSPGNPFKSYVTLFEFADRAVVYPPKSIDFNDVAMVVHLDIQQEGILSNPIRIKDMSISSKTFSQYDFNPIGTESGIPLYPYVKDGLFYNYKEKNPMLISKNRYPYLYLTQNSGVRLVDQQSLKKDYGIAFPINTEKNSYSRIGAFQLWMKYDLASFPTIEYSIFEIQSSNKTIEFIIRRDPSNKRATIIPRDKETKILESVPIFYQDGKRVKTPIIEINEWTSIGMLFEDPLVFDNYIGYINIFRGATFNNLSYYNYAGLNETTRLIARVWGQVLNDEYPSGTNNNVWQDWLYKDETETEFDNWLSLYVVDAIQSVSLTPEDIYKSFSGTNSIIVDDNTILGIDANSMNIFASSSRVSEGTITLESPIRWKSFSGKPA